MPALLHTFNVGNEAALRYSERASFTLSALVRQMRCDLALLPAWIAPTFSGDRVWMPQGANRCLPLFAGEEPLTKPLFEEDKPYRNGGKPLHLSLWAPEPTLIRDFQRRAKHFSDGLTTPDATVLPSTLFDRSLSHKMLCEWEGYTHLTPHFCQTNEEIRRALKSLSAFSSCIIKLPFSSSGRGVLPFALPLSERDEKRVMELLSSAGVLSIEPLLQKREDYAIEYFITPEGEVNYVGLSHFVTQDFRYLYNRVQHPDILWHNLAQVVNEKNISAIVDYHKCFLAKALVPFYHGPVGIDMLLYCDPRTRQVALHPAIEVNVRGTMGYLAHLLYQRFGASDTSYRMEIRGFAREGMAREEALRKKEKEAPLISSSGMLQKGTFLLTEPSINSRFYASLSVEK